MISRVWRGAGLLATAIIPLLAACQPDPTPGSVDLTGDSVTFQALLAGRGMDTEPPDLETYSGMGWRIDYAGGQQLTPQDWVHRQVYDEADPRPETLVTAFGLNDANPVHAGGWQLDDVGRFDDHINTPHPESCVVVVLPGLGPGADPELADEVDHARSDMVTVAGWREGPTVLVDWQPVIDADPSVVDVDGIHLPAAEGPEDDGGYGISQHAAEARLGMYWQGVQQCQGLS